MLKLHVNFTCTSDASLNMILSVYTCVFSVGAFSGTYSKRGSNRSVLHEQRCCCCCHGDAPLTHTPALSPGRRTDFHTHVCEDAALVIFNSHFEGQTSSKIKGAENRKWRQIEAAATTKGASELQLCASLKASPNKPETYNNFRNIYKHKFLLYFPQSVLARYYRRRLKEDSTPKMKTVIIYSKPVWMCLFWTQRKIFWRMRETEQYFSPTIEVNGAPKQPDYKLSSKHLPLCSEHIHTGLDLLEDE